MENGCLDTTNHVVAGDVRLIRSDMLPKAILALQPGETVLDLGSGDGTYSFLAAAAVGQNGHVIGVETASDRLRQARARVLQSGLRTVSFRLGELEYLPVADQSVDVIFSHDGVNQSSEKTQVFREAYRVLKPGGRVALVEMVATQPLSEDVEEEDTLYPERLPGVVMLDDLEDMLRAAGFDKIQSQAKRDRNGCPMVWNTNWACQHVVASALIEAVKPA